MKKHIIELSQEQRQVLEDLISHGKERARKIMHAHVLLKTDSGLWGPAWSGRQIQRKFTRYGSRPAIASLVRGALLTLSAARKCLRSLQATMA